jgi:hypothetical protein
MKQLFNTPIFCVGFTERNVLIGILKLMLNSGFPIEAVTQEALNMFTSSVNLSVNLKKEMVSIFCPLTINTIVW